MRIRLPELMQQRGLTAYALSRRSAGRISMSTAYRLARLKGKLQSFDAEMLEALCDIFRCPPGDLFERNKRRRKA